MAASLTVDLATYADVVSRYEASVKLNGELLAEIKRLREREPMTREMIAAELGVKPRNVDYYFNSKGLNPIRLGKLVCVCTRGELERWLSTDPVNFHQKL